MCSTCGCSDDAGSRVRTLTEPALRVDAHSCEHPHDELHDSEYPHEHLHEDSDLELVGRTADGESLDADQAS